jgi:hypothetical protein
MYTLNHTDPSRILCLIESLEHFAEAGIDPAFDAEYEELEREFAEIRFTSGNY